MQVFSRSVEALVDGVVMSILDENFVRVEYPRGEDWCGKNLQVRSSDEMLQDLKCELLRAYDSESHPRSATTHLNK